MEKCQEESVATNPSLEPIIVSLTTLSVLVQATRLNDGVQSLIDAMCALGRIGIRLDEETSEYFRMPTEGN